MIDLPKDIQQQQAEFKYPEEVFIPGIIPLLKVTWQINRAAKATPGQRNLLFMPAAVVVISGAHELLRWSWRKSLIFL